MYVYIYIYIYIYICIQPAHTQLLPTELIQAGTYSHMCTGSFYTCATRAENSPEADVHMHGHSHGPIVCWGPTVVSEEVPGMYVH
jgi:hypothetical protein